MVETETDPLLSPLDPVSLTFLTSYLSIRKGKSSFPGRLQRQTAAFAERVGRGGAFSCIQLQRFLSIPEEQRQRVHLHQTSSLCVCVCVHVCMPVYRGLRWMLGVCHQSFPSHLLRWGLSLTPGYWLAKLAGQQAPGITLSRHPPLPSACIKVTNMDKHIGLLWGHFTSELRSSLCFKHSIDRTISPPLKSSFKKCVCLNLIKEKVGSTLECIGTGNHFLNITPAAQTLRETINETS